MMESGYSPGSCRYLWFNINVSVLDTFMDNPKLLKTWSSNEVACCNPGLSSRNNIKSSAYPHHGRIDVPRSDRLVCRRDNLSSWDIERPLIWYLCSKKLILLFCTHFSSYILMTKSMKRLKSTGLSGPPWRTPDDVMNDEFASLWVSVVFWYNFSSRSKILGLSPFLNLSLMEAKSHALLTWSKAAVRSTNSKNSGCFFTIGYLMYPLNTIRPISYTSLFSVAILSIRMATENR